MRRIFARIFVYATLIVFTGVIEACNFWILSIAAALEIRLIPGFIDNRSEKRITYLERTNHA